jgi:hypothetical protein
MITRAATTADTDTIFQYGQSMIQKGGYVDEDDYIRDKEKLRRRIALGQQDILLVAEKNQTLVAFIFVIVHQPSGRAFIEKSGCTYEGLRQMAQEQLLAECSKQLKEKSIKRVTALIRQSNFSAQGVLLNQGFINDATPFIRFEKTVI